MGAGGEVGRGREALTLYPIRVQQWPHNGGIREGRGGGGGWVLVVRWGGGGKHSPSTLLGFNSGPTMEGYVRGVEGVGSGCWW